MNRIRYDQLVEDFENDKLKYYGRVVEEKNEEDGRYILSIYFDDGDSLCIAQKTVFANPSLERHLLIETRKKYGLPVFFCFDEFQSNIVFGVPGRWYVGADYKTVFMEE